MTELTENYLKVKEEIPKGVQIVAASKMNSIDKILELGKIDRSLIFGENRVQELLSKYTPAVRWHMIGKLQTNKVKYIIDKVEMIESLDRENLALEIEKQAGKIGKVMPCLVEVNIGGEEAKGGMSLSDTPSFLEKVKVLSHIKVEGLMTVAPISSGDTLKGYFKKMKAMYDKLKDKYNFKYLSMGMSSDFEEAIECGSNMVRLGRILFGERNYDV